MTTREEIIEDKDGNKITGLLAICENCGGEAFFIFSIHGHNHLQCVNCGTSFCQGGSNCQGRWENNKIEEARWAETLVAKMDMGYKPTDAERTRLSRYNE